VSGGAEREVVGDRAAGGWSLRRWLPEAEDEGEEHEQEQVAPPGKEGWGWRSWSE